MLNKALYLALTLHVTVLYFWHVSCHFSPTRQLVICKLLVQMLCKHRDSSTGKVTKEDFANASVHVTQTFKLLMCTRPESFHRLLQQKIHKLSNFLFFFLSVNLFWFCLFVVSESHVITMHFSLWQCLSLICWQLYTIAKCTRIVCFLKVRSQKTEFWRIKVEEKYVRACVKWMVTFLAFLAISQGTTITLGVSM